MEIIFLGTAGDFTSLNRSSPSIAVRNNEWIVLLDCGEGTSRQFVRAEMDSAIVDSILITHTHFDHILGLPAFLFNIWLQTGGTPSVFVPQNTKTVMDVLVKTMPIIPKINVNELNCSKRIRIAGLEMSCAKVDHRGPAVAYCLTNGSCKLVYTGDTRPSASVGKLAIGADILMHDCTFGDSERELARQTGHSTAAEAAEVAARARAKMLVLVHISEHYSGREEVLVKQAQDKYGGEIVVAQDLLKINL